MKKIIKNDTVKVLSGSHNFRGKTGRVLRVFNDYETKVIRDKRGRVKKTVRNLLRTRVIVEGVNIRVKHQKPNKELPQGGRIEKEMPIDISNVMLICPVCKQPTRVGFKILEDGSKVRVCKRKDCGEIIK